MGFTAYYVLWCGMHCKREVVLYTEQRTGITPCPLALFQLSSTSKASDAPCWEGWQNDATGGGGKKWLKSDHVVYGVRPARQAKFAKVRTTPHHASISWFASVLPTPYQSAP